MSRQTVTCSGGTATPHAYPPGEMPTKWVPGDVVLAHWPYSVVGSLIRFGERLRYRGKDAPFAWFNHAAIVVSPDPKTGQPRVVEALGGGVKLNPASTYAPRYFAYIDIKATKADRNEIVSFAEKEAEVNEEYGFVQIASIVASLVTNGRLTVGVDGSEICSALAAKALRSAGFWWERDNRIADESYLTPADLAAGFHTELIRAS